ncbi:hypothetical protein Pmar_PMAR008987 [Perkinsus marinus ATCC 50983]|uniref:Uncharacterized protein n=1 Tax=Perkinsus marinus (strain ATCC 50983 / TXsc) TaxID=423536 RepID=C5LM74_PERM5|nr:hypothetical protein Pmar_PMAR008987 [Perkinsus marinus ATCC 50983]EER02205.1 hypothetical protein Pmar_PMAR008987 [Perkinsus marinus ATCC 50983]|eukprot:XP_002769487.1 hypothetical protein Pmar_PMAR008987 [Perkinsus marinus ATCC 50983]
MVCSFATFDATNVLSSGALSKEVDYSDGSKPEVPAPPRASVVLNMILNEEGRDQLNQQQEPLVALLNLKAQNLGLGLKIASRGFSQPSFITKTKVLTTCAAPVSSDVERNLPDAAKIGEVTTENAKYAIVPDTTSSEDEEEVVTPEPPIKKQKTHSGALLKNAPHDTSTLMRKKRVFIQGLRCRGVQCNVSAAY